MFVLNLKYTSATYKVIYVPQSGILFYVLPFIIFFHETGFENISVRVTDLIFNISINSFQREMREVLVWYSDRSDCYNHQDDQEY